MEKKTQTQRSRRRAAAAFVLPVVFALSLGTQPVVAAEPEVQRPRLTLGETAPDFQLPDVVSGRTYSLRDFADKKGLLVVILCRHCPYVKHIQKALARFAKEYANKDLAIVALSANDPEAYPEDRSESLKEMAEEQDFTFPLLFDGTQETAKAFTAVATPDFFLFDAKRKLVYRGQFDDSRPRGGKEATGKDVRAAVDALLEGRAIPSEQSPAVGCSIKWKPGSRTGNV